MSKDILEISATSHLDYEKCPHSWELAYMRKIRLKKQNLAFYRLSSAIHFSVKMDIEGGDPFDTFNTYWERYKVSYPLVYEEGENWDSLRDLGIRLISKFREDFPARNITPIIMEHDLRIEGPGWVYRSRPDLIGDDNGYLVLDFKVTKEPISDIWLRGSDQMTGGAMVALDALISEPPIRVVIYNFVKNGSSIVWKEDMRTTNDISEYRKKLDYYAALMTGRYHPRRPLYAFNSPCPWCDFKEECWSDQPGRQEAEDFLADVANLT